MTRTAIAVLTIACALACPPRGWAEERLIDTARSMVTVRVFRSGLFRAFAHDHVIEAPLTEGSLGDATAPHLQLVIEPHRMRVVDPGLSERDRQEVQARMLGPDVLDVDRFPRITFHSLEIQRLDQSRWRVDGELELHGHFRPVSVTVVSENGRYTGSAIVRQSDFGMTPVSVMAGTVKVRDEVQIDFDVTALSP